MRGRKIATTLVVGLMLLQLAAAPAAATNTLANNDPCKTDAVDVVKYALTLGGSAAYDAGKCDVTQDSTDKHESAVYIQGSSAGDMTNAATRIARNNAQAMESAVWCRAEAEVVKQIEAGATRSEAMDNVTSLIDKRFSIAQINVIRASNSSINQVHFAWQLARDTNVPLSDSGSALVYASAIDPSSADYFVIGPVNAGVDDSSRRDYTLVNGTTVGTQAYEYDIDDGSNQNTQTVGPTFNGEIGVVSPTDDYSNLGGPYDVAYNATAYNQALSDIESSHQVVLDNAKKLVNNSYDNESTVTQGIEAQDLLSACSGSTFSTDKDDTGAYAMYRWAMMLAGEPTDVNSSFTIEWNPDQGVTVPGDTSIGFETPSGVTVTNLSLGSDAIVTGTETFAFDVGNVPGNVTTAELVIDDANGNTSVINATDRDGDGRWRAPVSSPSLRDAPDDSQLNVSVKIETDQGDVIETQEWAWTWDQSGAASITLTGALQTDWAPSKTGGSFDTGVTYDTANRDSVVYFIENGQTEPILYDLDNGNFTVVEMIDAKTGESVNSTELEDDSQRVVQTTVNKTAINKTVNYYQTNDENFDPKVGGGGGGLFNGNVLPAISGSVVLVAAAGAALLLLRD